jgi:hypothetical protein
MMCDLLGIALAMLIFAAVAFVVIETIVSVRDFWRG